MDSFGENGASERQLVLATGDMVDSPSRITLENNGKIRRQPDREKSFIGASGGGSGIRTHGDIAATPVFKTGALNRSAIPPVPFAGMREDA